MHIAMPLRRAFGPAIGFLDGVAARRPVATSMAVTAVKAGAADVFVQTYVERSGSIEPRRAATFALFGFSYQGCFQYVVINHLLEHRFPGRSIGNIIRKVCAVNLIADPIFFFPAFYTLREWMHTRSLGPGTFVTAMRNYSEGIREDLRNTWAVWFPGHMITFGVIPPHLRMPWVAALSFSYMVVLSMTRGAYRPSAERPGTIEPM